MTRGRFLATIALLATVWATGSPAVGNDAAAVSEIGEVDADVDIAATAIEPARIRKTPSLPSFSAQLSNLPVITGPTGWRIDGQTNGWAGLIAARPATRQSARWRYATRQIALGRGPEALGALEVMQQDDPDLALVASYQLALGAALTLLNRAGPADAALGSTALLTNTEACAWRMRALARAHLGAQALPLVPCALPALNARKVRDRAPFLLATAEAALEVGRPAVAEQLLAAMPTSDTAANLLRGRADIASSKRPQGRLLLAQVQRSGDRQQRLDAELSVLADTATQGAFSVAQVARLRDIRFIWRGDTLELRALELSYAVAQRAHDVRATLEAGAAIFRYFSGCTDRVTLVAALQTTLGAELAPDSKLPLDQIAGMYWDYRDLLPAGAAGDLLVVQLADRLQAAGLYERGAELLDHQLRVRARDIAQGPLSARVASLFILAGLPKRALAALRDTETNAYPDDMLWARHRVEAVALDQLGRTNEALAVLQDVPDGAAIRGELYWRRRDWKALAETVPAPFTAFTDVVQARILRLAVALAMLGRESDLARLRLQYGAPFAKLPTGPAFAALTAAVGTIDPATVSAAMAAIPSASPAGSIGDLIDAAPQTVGT